MDSENCKAFAMGFCPHEEFYVESVTERCPHPHITASREDYARQSQALPFEYEVLAMYKNIMKAIDKKIGINNSIIQEGSVGEQHYKALTKCQQLIDTKSTEFDDFEKLHSLLTIHGNLIQDTIELESRKQYSACPNCSSFQEGQKCTHRFCDKFKRLREIIRGLEKRLAGAETDE